MKRWQTAGEAVLVILSAMNSRIAFDDMDPLVGIGKGAIGAAVKAGRLRNRWPQRWLAFQAGVSQPVISRLENGKLTGIRWQTLARIIGVIQLGRGFKLPEDWEWAIHPDASRNR